MYYAAEFGAYSDHRFIAICRIPNTGEPSVREDYAKTKGTGGTLFVIAAAVRSHRLVGDVARAALHAVVYTHLAD